MIESSAALSEEDTCLTPHALARDLVLVPSILNQKFLTGLINYFTFPRPGAFQVKLPPPPHSPPSDILGIFLDLPNFSSF